MRGSISLVIVLQRYVVVTLLLQLWDTDLTINFLFCDGVQPSKRFEEKLSTVAFL